MLGGFVVVIQLKLRMDLKDLQKLTREQIWEVIVTYMTKYHGIRESEFSDIHKEELIAKWVKIIKS